MKKSEKEIVRLLCSIIQETSVIFDDKNQRSSKTEIEKIQLVQEINKISPFKKLSSENQEKLVRYASNGGYVRLLEYFFEQDPKSISFIHHNNGILHNGAPFPAVVNFALEKGLKGQLTVEGDIDKKTPLHFAIDPRADTIPEKENTQNFDPIKSAKILLAYKSKATAEDKNHKTPLHIAILHMRCGDAFISARKYREAYKRLAFALMAAGANIDAISNPKKHKETLFNSLPEEDKPDFQTAKTSGNTLVHRAVIDGDLEWLQLLIKKDFDINALNTDKDTPLHLALKHTPPDLQIILCLASAGANLHAENREQRTPLQIASTLTETAHGFANIVNLLLQNEADFKKQHASIPEAIEKKAESLKQKGKHAEEVINQKLDRLTDFFRGTQPGRHAPPPSQAEQHSTQNPVFSSDPTHLFPTNPGLSAENPGFPPFIASNHINNNYFPRTIFSPPPPEDPVLSTVSDEKGRLLYILKYEKDIPVYGLPVYSNDFPPKLISWETVYPQPVHYFQENTETFTPTTLYPHSSTEHSPPEVHFSAPSLTPKPQQTFSYPSENTTPLSPESTRQFTPEEIQSWYQEKKAPPKPTNPKGFLKDILNSGPETKTFQQHTSHSTLVSEQTKQKKWTLE